MKILKDLICEIEVVKRIGDDEIPVTGIAFDSRKVEPGFIFLAQKGLHTDGHAFIQAAIEKGATSVICGILPDSLSEGVTYVQVADANRALGLAASSFYDHPSRKMKVIGVTGTNGKTSIATLSWHLFSKLGYKTGLISTIQNIVDEKSEPSSLTTPDSLKIQSLMAEMVQAGCTHCFMEVSSHAVDQDRIAGIEFSGGIFTNLTHDHLDYHKTFQEYLKAKKRFFDQLPVNAFALTNLDDKNGQVMVQNTGARVATFSLAAMSDFRCRVIESHFDGMLLSIDGKEVWTRFVGRFNASNLLAIYSSAILLGQDKENVLTIMSLLTPVKGRFETIRSIDGKFAIVDYAHTPDALNNVLRSVNEVRSGNERVITVVGAGGDRDRTKRPEMAREALAASDYVILTSDNPRTEIPEAIIHDMEAGIEKNSANRVLSIVNRREAIKTAIMLAKPGDIILVAGKGHENYQEINGIRHHFDDREVIEEFFGLTI